MTIDDGRSPSACDYTELRYRAILRWLRQAGALIGAISVLVVSPASARYEVARMPMQIISMEKIGEPLLLADSIKVLDSAPYINPRPIGSGIARNSIVFPRFSTLEGTQTAGFNADVCPLKNTGVINGCAQNLTSSMPQKKCEYPQSSSGNKQKTGKSSHPPVWIRIPTALVLGFGSNGVLILGLLNFDYKRRVLGSALVGLAVLMFLGSGALMLALSIPATWDWWV